MIRLPCRSAVCKVYMGNAMINDSDVEVTSSGIMPLGSKRCLYFCADFTFVQVFV